MRYLFTIELSLIVVHTWHFNDCRGEQVDQQAELYTIMRQCLCNWSKCSYHDAQKLGWDAVKMWYGSGHSSETGCIPCSVVGRSCECMQAPKKFNTSSMWLQDGSVICELVLVCLWALQEFFSKSANECLSGESACKQKTANFANNRSHLVQLGPKTETISGAGLSAGLPPGNSATFSTAKWE